METTVDLDKLSAGELQELVKQVRKKEAEARNHQRDAYEALKKDTLLSIKDKLNALTEQTKYYYNFYEMTPYGGWKKIEPSFNKL